MLQVEFHPFHHDDALLSYCHEHAIQMVAYGSLRTTLAVRPSAELILKGIGERCNISTVGVVLAWALAKGVALIPRSTSEVHLTANLAIGLNVQPLSDSDVQAIDAVQLTEPHNSYGVLLSQTQHW